jgi:methionyl-tRNA synthetase
MSAGDHFYITTPIYYVNDKPHIGHAYTTILADVLARYHRLRGVPTHFLTGTDEHGQKVQQAADKAGMTPREQADRTVVRFQELWRKLEITNDDFIRTTEPRHTEVVRAILQRLLDNGDVYRAEYDGWYCVGCERYFMEKDLVEGGCPEPGCGRTVERIREANYFFRMSRYQEWLITYIEDHPDFIQPDFRRNETLGFLRKPLNDLCVSRPKSRLSWGIEMPFDPGYVTYVWFDALVNYISAVGYLADDARFARWWPASYHLIGKDILTTHTVYWPTMLQAMGLPQPRTVFAHGWWLVGRDKMGKSKGNMVDPMGLIDRCGVDAFRYFLMAEMSLGQDASFTEEAFTRRYNTDLANDLGNMLSRVLRLVVSHCGGRVPAPGDDAGADEQAIREAAVGSATRAMAHVEAMRLDLGLGELAAVIRECNRYLEKRQPWTLAKQGRTAELGTVLYHAAEALRIVSGMLTPVMPGKMTELRGCLGLGSGAPDYATLTRWGVLAPGTAVQKPDILFPRVEATPVAGDAEAGPAEAKSKVQPAKAEAAAKPAEPVAGVTTIEVADFQKVQLRTAEILSAEPVPGADKLLRLQIRIGEETRQIVAGIAKHYAPADLPGKTVVVVANLKPAKIRGVESNGMLLAASSGETLRLVTVDGTGLPVGATVK